MNKTIRTLLLGILCIMPHTQAIDLEPCNTKGLLEQAVTATLLAKLAWNHHQRLVITFRPFKSTERTYTSYAFALLASTATALYLTTMKCFYETLGS